MQACGAGDSSPGTRRVCFDSLAEPFPSCLARGELLRGDGTTVQGRFGALCVCIESRRTECFGGTNGYDALWLTMRPAAAGAMLQLKTSRYLGVFEDARGGFGRLPCAKMHGSSGRIHAGWRTALEEGATGAGLEGALMVLGTCSWRAQCSLLMGTLTKQLRHNMVGPTSSPCPSKHPRLFFLYEPFLMMSLPSALASAAIRHACWRAPAQVQPASQLAPTTNEPGKTLP
jgi:hypothetical protein